MLVALLAVAAPSHAAPWRLIAPMPEPRWFHAAGVGSDGRIYAYAGYVRSAGRRAYGIGEHALVIYDPATNRWERGPAIEAAQIKGLGRVSVGWFDENHVKQRKVVLEERTSSVRLEWEVPTGRADAFGLPRWPGRSYWVPFDPGQNAWAEVERAEQFVSTEVVKPKEKRWKHTGPAYFRYSPAVATSPDGVIYITGGAARPFFEHSTRSRPHESAEAWDAKTNRWREIATMRHARDQHAAAVDRKGRLFVFGGTTGSVGIRRDDEESDAAWDARGAALDRAANTSLASVEMYDPATNTWTERAPMPTPRQAMGADVGADGRIYVVGGAPSFMHPRPMDVVEIYDPETNTWETGPPLVYPRRSHAVVATPDGKLYAIGGFVAPRAEGIRDRLLGAKVDPALGATVEVLDTRAGAGEPHSRR